MTVDFGLLTQDDYNNMGTPNAIQLQHMEETHSLDLSLWGWLVILAAVVAGFVWRRRVVAS
jgi:hypothetical protein